MFRIWSQKLGTFFSSIIQPKHTVWSSKSSNWNILNYFYFSLSPDQLEGYPIKLFIHQIIVPMVAMSIIALKIILKNGKAMKRELFWKYFTDPSVCRFKSQSYLSPSSDISIVWRADSWRRWHATLELSALPNDGDAARWR